MAANPYQVLGIRPGATADQIRTAYRSLARLYHPDLNPGRIAWANARMAEVNVAYQQLSGTGARLQESQRRSDPLNAMADKGRRKIRRKASEMARNYEAMKTVAAIRYRYDGGFGPQVTAAYKEGLRIAHLEFDTFTWSVNWRAAMRQ